MKSGSEMPNCPEFGSLITASHESSGQGEAERTNSTVGDAIINGGSIKWEYFPRFHDKTDEEI